MTFTNYFGLRALFAARLLSVVNGQSIVCGAGKIPDSSLLSMLFHSCVDCPSGTYSNSGDTECTSCQAGQTSPAGSAVCGHRVIQFTSVSEQLDSPASCGTTSFSVGDTIILDCSTAFGSCYMIDNQNNYYISTLYSAAYTFESQDIGTDFIVYTDSLDGLQFLGYTSASFSLGQSWNECTNLITLSSPTYGPSYNFSTIGTFSAGFDNGYAWESRFSSPQGVAYDSMMNLYIADSKNNVIRKLEYSTAVVVTFAGDAYGSSGSSDGHRICEYDDYGYLISGGTFFNPTGLAIDSQDNIYVADSWNSAIRKIDGRTGYVTTIIGPNSPEFYNPHAIAISSTNILYIADSVYNFVKAVDLNNNNAISLPSSMSNISYPSGLAVDSSGNIYVSAYDENIQYYVVMYFDSNAESIKNVTSYFWANGLAVDSKGNVFIGAGPGLQMIENGTSSIINVDIGNASTNFVQFVSIAPYYGYMAISDLDYNVVYQLYPKVTFSTLSSNATCICETTTYLFATPTYTILSATVTYSSVDFSQATLSPAEPDKGRTRPSENTTRVPSTGKPRQSAFSANSAASSYNSTNIVQNRQTDSTSTSNDSNTIYIGFGVALVLMLIIAYHIYHLYYSKKQKNQIVDGGNESKKTKADSFKLKSISTRVSDPETTVQDFADSLQIPFLRENLTADEKERLANYLNSR